MAAIRDMFPLPAASAPALSDPDDPTTIVQETLVKEHIAAFLDSRKSGGSGELSGWTFDDLKQVRNKLPPGSTTWTDLTGILNAIINNKGPAQLRAQLATFRGVVLQETTGERKKL